MESENFDYDREKTEGKNCKKCGMCCKYVALEIDCPEDLDDFENIKWYVAHKNVNVFVNEDNEWHIEFITPCAYLGQDNLCGVYGKRPQICRDYSADSCLAQNNYSEKYTFKTIDDVKRYIEEVFNKGLHEFPEKEEDEDEEDEYSDEDEKYDDENYHEEDKSESPSEFISRKDRDYYY